MTTICFDLIENFRNIVCNTWVEELCACERVCFSLCSPLRINIETVRAWNCAWKEIGKLLQATLNDSRLPLNHSFMSPARPLVLYIHMHACLLPCQLKSTHSPPYPYAFRLVYFDILGKADICWRGRPRRYGTWLCISEGPARFLARQWHLGRHIIVVNSDFENE